MPDNAADYQSGSIKRHPAWPETKIIVMRTDFQDTDLPGTQAWQSVSPSMGSNYYRHDAVKAWPDVEGMTLLTADLEDEGPAEPEVEVGDPTPEPDPTPDPDA